jgi:hypothetical protein
MMLYIALLCVLLISVLLPSFASAAEVVSLNASTVDPKMWLKSGNCKGLWRDDKLIGKCFGFYSYKKKYPQLNGVEVITSAECRSLCCNMGDRCINWQFYSDPSDPNVHECKITDKIVRLGFEKTGTPDWCDPHPPARWNGHRIVSRKADGTCEAGDILPYQCFGLGDERKDGAGNALDENGCAEACCKDPKCDMWQQFPGRGCYYSKNVGRCNKNTGVFEGGRKCVKGHCDGKEASKLTTSN